MLKLMCCRLYAGEILFVFSAMTKVCEALRRSLRSEITLPRAGHVARALSSESGVVNVINMRGKSYVSVRCCSELTEHESRF